MSKRRKLYDKQRKTRVYLSNGIYRSSLWRCCCISPQKYHKKVSTKYIMYWVFLTRKLSVKQCFDLTISLNTACRGWTEIFMHRYQYDIINGRDVQGKNVVNNVDKSSLWATWQNGPYKNTQYITKHGVYKDATNIKKYFFVFFLECSIFYVQFSNT